MDEKKSFNFRAFFLCFLGLASILGSIGAYIGVNLAINSEESFWSGCVGFCIGTIGAGFWSQGIVSESETGAVSPRAIEDEPAENTQH